MREKQGSAASQPPPPTPATGHGAGHRGLCLERESHWRLPGSGVDAQPSSHAGRALRPPLALTAPRPCSLQGDPGARGPSGDKVRGGGGVWRWRAPPGRPLTPWLSPQGDRGPPGLDGRNGLDGKPGAAGPQGLHVSVGVPARPRPSSLHALEGPWPPGVFLVWRCLRTGWQDAATL